MDVLRFVKGRKQASKIKHLHITFDHETCLYEDMMDYFTTSIESATAPFSIKEVFDRKVLTCLEGGSCKLVMSSEDFTEHNPREVLPFKHRVEKKMKTLFPTDGLAWVEVGVNLEERYWDFIDF